MTFLTPRSHGSLAAVWQRIVLGVAAAIAVSLIALAQVARYLERLHALDLSVSARGGATSAFANGVWTSYWIILLIQCVIGVLFVVLLLRSISRPMQRLRNAVLSLATKDTNAIQTDSVRSADDELAPLYDVLRSTRDEIASLTRRVVIEADCSRALIEVAFSAVLVVDGGGRIIRANSVAAQLLSQPEASLCGLLLPDLFVVESLRMHVDAMGTLTCHESSDATAFSTRVRLHGARSFPADVKISALAAEGQRAWAILINDLTSEQKAATALRDALTGLEGADRARSALLSRMSHELRTPLNSMIGFARIVRRSKSSELSERDSLYLDRATAGGEQLLALVNDILDLSRIDAGAIEMRVETVDVVALVREVMPTYRAQVADRPVTLDVTLPNAVGMAQVDAQRLRQVIAVLLSNAVKFTARGTIEVSVRLNHLTRDASAIIVRDTGIGIPLDRQAQIFDAFEESDRDANQRYGGHGGLGLPLSRKLAQQMHCELSVESVPGSGSTFTFAFARPGASNAMHKLALSTAAA